VTEIRVQRKARRSRKWAWLLLLLIPAVWFALNKGGPEGGDEAAAADSARAASTSADSGRAKPADAVTKADSTKPPL
jgi:4-amino-4-deoxy-L-arabinose transferase-like glycosyltransferase